MLINLLLIVLFLILLAHRLRKPLLVSLYYGLSKTIIMAVDLLFLHPQDESLILLLVGFLISFMLSWLLGWFIAWLQVNYPKKFWAYLPLPPVMLLLLLV